MTNQKTAEQKNNAPEDQESLVGELQKGGMPTFGGPTFSETGDISPYTPPTVKTSKPSTASGFGGN